jgi:hypothetical protein
MGLKQFMAASADYLGLCKEMAMVLASAATEQAKESCHVQPEPCNSLDGENQCAG